MSFPKSQWFTALLLAVPASASVISEVRFKLSAGDLSSA